MADREEILRPLRPALVPVPRPGQLGVCPTCLSSRSERYPTCQSCAEAARLQPPSILPVSMSVSGGTLHYHLRQYKDSPSQRARTLLTRRLAALLATFMEHHATCIGAWDQVTSVPSRRRDALEPVLARLKVFHERRNQILHATGAEGERCVDAGQ